MAEFTASGRGRYTVIVYKNTDAPIQYTLEAEGALIQDTAMEQGLAVQLP